MEVDYKLIISILALSISIYALLGNRRISTLEKRTEIMAEVSEIQYIIAKALREYDNLLKHNLEDSLKLKVAIQEGIEALIELQDTLDAAFNTLKDKKVSLVKMEEIRPLLQPLLRKAKEILNSTNEFKKDIIEQFK